MKRTIYYPKQLLWFIVLHFCIDVHSCFAVFVSGKVLYCLWINARIEKIGDVSVPLRYNNDKQKKPLFSRGLSVCRLLFNSFSKLKIDENYKEKRRLFY